MKIDFIGLGNLGGKLASSLLRNKFELIVRDLDKNLTKEEKPMSMSFVLKSQDKPFSLCYF